MTNVEINWDGGCFDIRVEGHADYAQGVDIVCSAVSMLSFTLMQALRNEEDDGNLQRCDIRYSSGDVHIAAVPAAGCRERIRVIVDTVATGFELLADRYPDNVELKW